MMTRTSTRTGSAGTMRRSAVVGRWALRLSALLLAAFHADLLLGRIADGSLASPVVAARWAATVGIAAWAMALRRRGTSLWKGRSAVAFWLVVALVHAVPGAPLAPVASWSIEASSTVPLTWLAALAVAGWLLGALPAVPTLPRLDSTDGPASNLRSRAALAPLAPRAPPV